HSLLLLAYEPQTIERLYMKTALRVAGEQQTKGGERKLDERRLDDRDDEFSASRRSKNIEPGIDEQERRGRGRRTLEPGRAPPGGGCDREQKERQRDVKAGPSDVPVRRPVCGWQRENEQHDPRHEPQGRQPEQRH